MWWHVWYQKYVNENVKLKWDAATLPIPNWWWSLCQMVSALTVLSCLNQNFIFFNPFLYFYLPFRSEGFDAIGDVSLSNELPHLNI